MKNKKSIIIGVLLAVVFILFLNGLFQYLIALLLGGELEKFQFTTSGFSPVLVFKETTSVYVKSISILSPLVVTVFFVEVLFIVLGKSVLGLLRFSTIVLLLFLSGYLMLSVFYSLIELVLFPTNNALLGRLVQLWQIEGNQIYVVIIFTLVILLAYLQVVQKRVMQYLSVNKNE